MSRKTAPVTSHSLHAAALAYLERYAASRAHLRRVLLRRVDRSIAGSGGERTELVRVVDALLDTLEGSGALDDARYAAGRARSLLRRGASERAIGASLASRGVERSLAKESIEAALDEVREDGLDPVMAAACATVRKRRMGPYRPPEQRGAWRDRDLARLARAGFSYLVARQVIDLPTPDEVEALTQPR
jgi:regulatory protein